MGASLFGALFIVIYAFSALTVSGEENISYWFLSMKTTDKDFHFCGAKKTLGDSNTNPDQEKKEWLLSIYLWFSD